MDKTLKAKQKSKNYQKQGGCLLNKIYSHLMSFLGFSLLSIFCFSTGLSWSYILVKPAMMAFPFILPIFPEAQTVLLKLTLKRSGALHHYLTAIKSAIFLPLVAHLMRGEYQDIAELYCQGKTSSQ